MSRRLVVGVVVMGLAVAACGSGASGSGVASLEEADAGSSGIASLDGSDGSDGSGVVAGDGETMDSEEAMLALAECLRGEGFDVQDPEIDDDGFPRLRSMFQPLLEAGDIDRQEVGAAMQSCSEYVDAITTEFGRRDRDEIEDQMYEYAACMRDNGYDMPDPDFSGEPGQGQGGGGPFGQLDREDPDFQAANEECRDLFAGPGGGPGGGRPPAGGA